MTSRRVLQALLWSIGLAHAAIGLGLNLVPGFAPMIAPAYGADVERWSPQFLYILRPLGAFMLAMAVAAALAALDPERYRPVIYVFVGLFLIRCLHRVALGGELEETFGITGQQRTLQIVFLLGLAASLIIFDQLSHRRGRATTPAPAA